MFIAPCSGPNRSELQGNIQKIASRTTPFKIAFYPKGNAVDNTPDRFASHNVNAIGCASDISNDGRRIKNKRETIIKSRSMFISPCSGSEKSVLQGNIQNIASRSTAPPSKSAYYPKGNAVDDTSNHCGKNNIPSKYFGKSQTNSSSQFQMPPCGHRNVVDQTKHDGYSNICQDYVNESSKGELNSKEMVPLLIADDTDIGEIYEMPRTSHRTQEFDSQQDDSGASRELTVQEKDSRQTKRKGNTN